MLEKILACEFRSIRGCLEMKAARHPCLFLDRDGVINLSPGSGYVTSWDGFRFSPGILDALAVARERGFVTAVISNQQGVAKGLMTEDDLDLIHSRMQSMLGELAVDRIYACVDPAGSPRRKPNPTMVFEAQEDLNLDLGQSWFVGDTDGDMQCAKAAGVGAIRVLLPGRTIREEADFEIASVAELAELLDRILRPLV